MKKMCAPKLVLHRETLRSLERANLTEAAGGVPTIANSCTVTLCGHTCPTGGCNSCFC